jgi:hypothetical protein
MPQHSKKTHNTVGTRPDLTTARQTEDTYIARIEGPKIGDRAEWVRSAYSRGVSFRELIKGSGLRTKQVLTLCGLDPDSHIDLVAELESFRTNLLNHRA